MSRLQSLGRVAEPIDEIEGAEFVEIKSPQLSVHQQIFSTITRLRDWWANVSLFVKVPLALIVMAILAT